MKEAGFYIQNVKHKVSVEGGRLWEATAKEDLNGTIAMNEDNKELSIYLFPQASMSDLRDELYQKIKERSFFSYLYFAFAKGLPSLILLLPITLTVMFIGFITIYGDLIKNWVFLVEDQDTLVGLTQRQSIVIYTVIAVLVIYFFPVFLTGEQDGFIQAINERFSNRKLVRKRFAKVFKFLYKRGYLKKVVLWNPNLLELDKDWVQKSLIPALLDIGVDLELQVKTDERSTAEHYLRKVTKDNNLQWNEYELPYVAPTRPIPYDYLENWEKKLLAVYVFSSTANLPNHWMIEGSENEGVLENTLSLPLVKIIIDRFAARLFSEDDRKHLISLDAFASRALNDFGILFPKLQYTNDVWGIEQSVVDKELTTVQEEMRFIASFLQTEIHHLTEELNDPVAALLLNAQQEKNSIYNQKRLEAIRFFVKIIHNSEQYKILKSYWELISQRKAEEEGSMADLYRILGVDLLDQLATLFERAAIYDQAILTLDYLETVYPYRAKMGKARITERQGDFRASVEAMLEIHSNWKANQITLSHYSVVDLQLNLAWAIVSGRLDDYRQLGRAALKDAQNLLYIDFDQIRNSGQIIRSYNILANYEEWEGKPEGSILSYDKALQIPGVAQSSLSNLLVNKGIALRQMKELKKGAIFGEQGVEIKTAIGDLDQLPIAQHNLAQTYIELAFSILDGQARQPYFEKARFHAQNGLDIQSETGSVKKRGQLLFERFIANYELCKQQVKLKTTVEENWQAAKAWLAAEADAGRADTYDCRVIVKELLGCLKEFEGDSLEEAINWQPL
jgi:hypothetical protein